MAMKTLYATLINNEIHLDSLTFKLLYQIGNVSVKDYNNFLKRYEMKKVKVIKKDVITIQQAHCLSYLADKSGYKFIFDEPEYKVSNLDTSLGNITLRDYQEESVKHILTKHSGILKLAVNAGKTEILASVCKNYNKKILIVVNSKNLLHQTHDRILEYLPDIDIGKCGDGKKDVEHRVVVGMPQTLCNLELDFDLILCDEVDTLVHKTCEKVYKKMKNARMFGLSGSPFKKNDMEHELKVRKLFGNILIDVETTELTKRNISAKGLVIFHKLPPAKQPNEPAYDEVEAVRNYKNYIVNNMYRNAKICTIANIEWNKGKTIYISVQHETHMNELKRMLSIKVPEVVIATMSGQDSSKSRKSTINKIKNGEIKIIIATSVIGRGVSIDELDVLINAAGGQSSLQVIQRLGRILRNREGKFYTYHDFVDYGCDSHTKHSRRRYNQIKTELGIPIQIVKDVQKTVK